MRFDLRALADAMDADRYPGGDILRDAADELVRLQAENGRLSDSVASATEVIAGLNEMLTKLADKANYWEVAHEECSELRAETWGQIAKVMEGLKRGAGNVVRAWIDHDVFDEWRAHLDHMASCQCGDLLPEGDASAVAPADGEA